jgi:hypothetical protein
MREVQVLDYNNVDRALNKNAIQSSTITDSAQSNVLASASRAVDGNNNTWSHTNRFENRKYHILLLNFSSIVSL